MAKTDKIATPTPSSPPWATGATLQPGAVAPVATPPSPVESGLVAATTAPATAEPAKVSDNPPTTPQSAEVAATLPPPVLTPTVDSVEVADELIDMVTVTVPRPFKLRVDNFREVTVPAGVQEMERELAEHWYSVANGVRIYQK